MDTTKINYILDNYYDKLTDRSIKVMTSLVHGRTYSDLSKDLGCSVNSLRKVVANQLKRFNLQDWTPPPGYAPLNVDRSLRIFRAKFILANYPKRLSRNITGILELIADGKSNTEAAEAMGTSVGYIAQAWSKQMTRFGCNKITPDNPNPIPPKSKGTKQVLRKLANLADVQMLYHSGFNNLEIMAKVHVSASTLNHYYSELGLKSRPVKKDQFGWLSVVEANRVKNVTEKRVLERRLARGMTVGEMAVLDGRKRQFILEDMERLGIPIPDHENWHHTRDGAVKKREA